MSKIYPFGVTWIFLYLNWWWQPNQTKNFHKKNLTVHWWWKMWPQSINWKPHIEYSLWWKRVECHDKSSMQDNLSPTHHITSHSTPLWGLQYHGTNITQHHTLTKFYSILLLFSRNMILMIKISSFLMFLVKVYYN